MGHYDDCYEADREQQEKKRRTDLLDWIGEKLPNLSNHNLEMIYEIMAHADDYQTFFDVIKKVAK